MSWRIVLDINFNLPGVLPFLKTLQGNVMQKLDELNAKADQVVTNTNESNAKTDLLIAAANSTKDELVTLRGDLAAGGFVTAEQLDAVIAKLDTALTAQDAQDVETDAAAAAVAP